MTQTIFTVPVPDAGPDFTNVSDAMLYDIARHTASVLSAQLLSRKQTAESDSAREHWTARRRLVKQQARALDPANRAGIIAQDEVWRLEKLALAGG